MAPVQDPIIARFSFIPDRAPEFVEAEGQTVVQMEFDAIDEVMECVHQFQDALEDCSAIINGKVVNLSDHTEEA